MPELDDPQAEPDTALEPDTAADAAGSTEAPAEDDTARTGEDVDGGKLRKEAARYRTALRTAEGERDALRVRVETMQRREVERLAEHDLDKPADVWLVGTVLPDLLDDAGDVDPAEVAAAVQRIVADRPGWRRLRNPSMDGGVRTGPHSTSGAGWSDLLGGKAPRR